MPSVDLANHQVKPTPYGRWQQLNGTLGVNAFGLNAIVLDPGEDIDIEHDETDSGHQEVYVVVEGRARFTIGGETIVAGPGTVVAAVDPAATRIVCIGAAPGAEHPYGEWIDEAEPVGH